MGAQIFFKDSKGEPCHTGIVYKVDANYVYTIEGNTSSASGVVANGGAVERKKYTINYSRIFGYGVPKYDKEPAKQQTTTATANKSKASNNVKQWQLAAIADGFKFPKYGADGEWGAECEAVAKEAIVKQRLTYKYKNLTKIVQKAVGVEADGKCGSKTKAAIKAYQKKKGLTADGAVGLNTWKKILGIK